MMRDKHIGIKWLALALALPMFPISGESEGEALFKENKGEAAIAPLEREIASGDITSDKYNFLGLAYYQKGDYKRSIDAFENGMKIEGVQKWVLSYNAGNSAFALGNFSLAEGYYSDAYKDNGEFHAALLNRANARLEQDKIVEARDDYTLYLDRCPSSPQEERIKVLIALLDEEIRTHAILPEKLDSADAVIPITATAVLGAEAVDEIYKESDVIPPAQSMALEKEAALIQSAPPLLPSPLEAVSSGQLTTKVDNSAPVAESMSVIVPPLTYDEVQSPPSEALINDAPPPVLQKPLTTEPSALPSETLSIDVLVAPPVPAINTAASQAEAIDNITPPIPQPHNNAPQSEALQNIQP